MLMPGFWRTPEIGRSCLLGQRLNAYSQYGKT